MVQSKENQGFLGVALFCCNETMEGCVKQHIQTGQVGDKVFKIKVERIG